MHPLAGRDLQQQESSHRPGPVQPGGPWPDKAAATGAGESLAVMQQLPALAVVKLGNNTDLFRGSSIPAAISELRQLRRL